MPDKAFVNPQWDKYAIVYYSGDWVSKTEFAGSTQATCYHTLEDAYDQSGLDTFYIYNDPDSPLSLVAPSGTYVQTNSCYITKNLYVHADTFQLEYSTYEKGLNIYGVTVDFRVSNSFKVVDTKARLNVANGAYFQLGANEGVTSVFLDNCGTVYVESASFSAPSVTNSREISLNEASFSVASVTNTGDGTFKVKGTSSLTIGALSGTILTDSTAATTLNASSISGGAITAQNALNFTGANTLNGVTLNAAGNTVTVGTAEGDSLTLSGTSTLKDSNINGSSISAQGNLTFSGANTLNGVTLDAAGNTVTVGTDEGDSLTVGGTSTLTIGTLNGEIKTAANTTLQNSNISGGGTNGGAITAHGAITVNNSTITSSKFTATKAIGANFSGACILDSVKLDAGTWDSVNVSVDGTLTIKGETTLKIASIFAYNGTIYLDGATIKDSSIVGGQSGAYGGTLVVESGKTATFSTSSNAYSNNFGRTSISNSGSITVNGLMTCGTIDNTNGTIALNGGSKLTSGISGGNITTSDTGIVTVQYSTISSSAFTATADEVIFYDQNTLNSVTLNATAENTTVKANGTLTVEGTNTLNIRSLDGTIKTAGGVTLTGSDINGGGTNGGTITALGTLTFANKTHLRNITLDAHDQTVDTGSSYSLWLGGAITLKIGTLISSILLDEDTTFTNSTISNGNNSSRLFIYGGKAVTFAGANTIFDANVNATGYLENDGGSITVESKSNDDKGKLTVYWIKNSGDITVGSAGSANEAADACSLTATLLNNGGTITVNGENQNNRSLLDAAYITNGDNNNHTGMMSLTNSVLNATRLENYGRGEFDPGPPRTSQAAITISDSIVSITDSLTNGAANNTSATIEFNNSTVTADSVTNYGTHNGTDGNTGRVGFAMTDSTFTVNNTFTNYGWIYVNNSTLHATSLVNNGNRFYVYGTSTLNIGTLTGRIDIINGNDTGSLVTLNNSHITGKVNGDGSLGSSIYVSNPLTFTGTNTLTNTQFYATAANKIVTVDSGATLTVKGTSKLNIASLDGTILTDSEAATTLKDSSITGGGTNGGTITAQNDLTFTGENTLNSVTLNAANKTVTNAGTLTARGTLSFDGVLNVAGNASLAVGNGAGMTVTGNISNSGSITVTGTGSLSVANIINNYDNSNENDNGTITVDALSTLKAVTVSGGRVTVQRDSSQVLTEDVYHVVDAKLQEDVSVGFIGDLGDYAFCPSFNSGLYLFKKDPSTVYVNRNYPAQPNTLTPDGHLVGVNAFTNNPDGTETSLHFSNNTEKIVYYANENAYAALNLAVDNAPASLTITTEAVGNNEVVTMGPLTVGAGQTVTLSGAKMTLTDATEPAASSLSISSGSTLNVGVESAASGLTAQTVNNAGTINVTNSTFAASTLSTSAVDDRFFVAGESTLNIDSLNGKIKLNDGATIKGSTVYSDVNVEETTTSCSGRLVIATGSSVTFAGANTFRDNNNVKGVAIGNLGSVTVKSIAASGDNPAVAGALKVFGFDNVDTLTVGSNSDACTFDVINLNNYHALTVNGKTDDLSRLKASLIKNYGTIELTKAIAEAGSLQNGNESNITTTIGITNSEFTADSVTNYSSGISNVREGMTVINSTLFKANSLVNNGTIKFRGKNKLDIGSLSGTLHFDVAEGTQATLNDSSITGGTLQAVSMMKFIGENTLTSVTLDAQNAPVTVGTDDGDSLTVKGMSKLKDVLLNGTILTDNSTTLKNSNITGGAITASGSVTVNNSTISSNTFTCNAASYFGVTFTGENTLDSVTLNASYVTNGGSLTVKGESELHIGDVEDNNHDNGTIKLDGATIINSSIVGGAHGGTLVVESGKTATFSTTGSNRNNLANTSIINSGTSATSYGTITVNGKMSCGTVTNNAYAKIFISDADVTAGTVTNLAETGGSTGSQITVTDSSFTASTVSVNFYADFYVSGESTLDIGNLTGTIRLNDGATISNSAVYADINNSYSGKLNVGAYSSVIFAGSNTFLSNNKERGLYVEINGSATVQSTSNQKGELKGHHIQVGNLTVGSETDACIVDTISLRNGGTLTVNGKTNERSRLQAQSIENYTTSSNGSMSLTNTVLETETLVNTCVGTLDNKPGITITDSEAFVGSLRNGNESYRVATIKIENSKFTAGSITNYSKGPENEYGQLIRPGIAITGSTIRVGLYDNDHNVVAGTGDINNASATITVTNSEFTALGTLTINCKQGLEIGDGIKFTNSTVSLASIINNGTSQTQTWRDDGYLRFEDSTLSVASVTNRGVFLVLGTSKLDIGTLDGTIETSDSGATLNDSSITGGGTNGGTISARNSLTFTGANTLNGITLNAAGKTVTVGNSALLTVKGTSTLNIGNLNGTIKTDSEATTSLKNSSITGGGTNGGTITSQNSLTFTGANTLKSVTLTATNQTVTIDSGATLNVNALSRITASAVSGGVLNVTTTGLTLSDMTQNTYHVVNADLQGNITVKLNDSTEATSVTIGTGEEAKTYNFIKLADQDLYLTTEDQSVLYVNSAYTEDSCDGHVYGYNAFSSAEDAALVAAESGAAVDVGSGTYTEITELRGAKTVIQKDNGTTEFTKAVYGGTKVTDGGSDTRNTDVTIEGGTFGKFFVGGNNIAMPTTDTTYTVNGSTQSVAISGGTFQAIVATADRVQKGAFTLNSVLEMNISGGQFNYFVAGGLLNSLYEKDGEVEKTNGTAEIHGDVSLNITGGTFDDDCWIYGGCVSTSRSVSSYASTIYGNVTITIDCGVSGESERNDIVLSHVVAGSHGLGHILENSTTHSGGNTAIVFKGDNNSGGETPHSLIRFTDDGELWGGCGRDNLSPVTGKCADSFVQGDRLLSFEGFTGELNCKQIRDFSSIQLIDESNVTLTESTVNLRGFETWTFEYDSCLSGNFGNDFNRDTLNLTGLDAKSFDDWTILTNSSDTAFKGFGSFSSVSFGTGEGSAASYSSGSDVWYNDAYVLYCSENSMLLTTNASYVTRFGSIA